MEMSVQKLFGGQFSANPSAIRVDAQPKQSNARLKITSFRLLALSEVANPPPWLNAVAARICLTNGDILDLIICPPGTIEEHMADFQLMPGTTLGQVGSLAADNDGDWELEVDKGPFLRFESDSIETGLEKLIGNGPTWKLFQIMYTTSMPMIQPPIHSIQGAGSLMRMNDALVYMHVPGFEIVEASWVGQREAQEDVAQRALRNNDGGLLLSVLDGMGGHNAGEIAAQVAGQAMNEQFLTSLPEDFDLAEAARQASLAVWDKARGDVRCAGMGTTMASALFLSHTMQARFFQVGDSRIYRVREGELALWGLDDISLISHYVGPLSKYSGQAGFVLTGEDLEAYHTATRDETPSLSAALGLDFPHGREAACVAMQPGDIYLLATDGLETISAKLNSIFLAAHENPQSLFDLAVQLMQALKNFNKQRQDNTLFSLVRVLGETTWLNLDDPTEPMPR